MEEKIGNNLPKGYHLKGAINDYIIDRVLGQGAFGITYLARYRTTIQGTMGRGSGWTQVAIKEFFMRDLNVRDGSTGYLNDSSQDSLIGRYRRAFMREARNLAGLHHDNIVNVFEVIEANNTVYIIMEYINGGSLDEHIAQAGHLSQDESIDKMLQLCSAVECMHEHRMLHLDIKPRNVMLDEDGQLYLIDFGLSKQYTADGEPESSTSIGLGTPGYAPVEQAEHQDGDKKFRATIDVYALGATLFKMLTGNTPPKASQVSDSVIGNDNIIPKRLKECGITDSLAAVVAKAMFPSSIGRYQTVQELERALMEIKESTLYQESTVVVPEHVSNQIPEPVEENHSPNPKPEQEPQTGATKGLPKWLYAVIVAIVVGLILIIPKLKTPQDAVSIQDKQAKEEVATLAPNQTPSQQEEVVPTTTSKPVESEQETPKTIALTSISLNKTSLTLEEGATSTLYIEYSPSNATDKSTTWESTNTNVAIVNSNGTVTAVGAGGAAIIATCGKLEKTCRVTVKAKVIPLTSISLNKTSLTLEEGATSTLYIEYSPSNATDKSTTWKSTNTNVAIVNSNGTVTAVGAGDAVIIATCWELEKTCRVTVKAKVIPLTSISLNKTSLTLEEGSSSTLSVYYSPSDATDKSIAWKSSDPGIATVSNTGVVTAVKAGSAAIVAYSADGIDAFCNLTVTAKNRATGTVNGHEWVDLGLSVKWATCNVGASSPSAYGDYYAWGETSTKSSYTWVNYRFRTSGDSRENVKFSKYNTNSDRGTVDNRTTLELSDDVARQKWGGSWRMPTITEFQELIDNCTWTWTTMNGVNGYKVTSKKSGFTDRSIFLPAAGFRIDASLDRAGEYGDYWSSSLNTDNPYDAQLLSFTSGGRHTNYYYRIFGPSVRPVYP